MSELNRILWACRRGMLECDLFLIPFAKSRYLNLSPEQKAAFQLLLSLPDQTLYHYLMGSMTINETSLRPIIAEIQAFKRQNASEAT